DKYSSWKKNLIVLSLSQFMAMAGFGCCMPFIPLLLKNNLHVDNESMRGVYVSLYYMTGMIGLTIAYPIWGMLADRFGRKIMVLRASYIAGLLYPLLSLAPNFWCLLSIRAFTSLFSGTVNPAQTLLLTSIPKERHGLALGMMSTAIWSGDMAGYLLGGVMVDHFGYTVAFFSCGAVYILSGLLVHVFAEEHFTPPSLEELQAKAAKRKKPSLKSLMSPGVGWLLLLFLLMGISRRIESPFVAMIVEKINGPEKAATITGITSTFAALGGIVAGLLIGRLTTKYSAKSLLLPVILSSGIFAISQALSVNITMLWITRFLTFMAAGCLQPVLQMMITSITDPAKHGAYLGWTASLNSGGGILCSFISAPLAWFVGVRGIFVASGVILLIMIPMLIPAMKAYQKGLDLMTSKADSQQAPQEVK
ncbi:MAG: MFS transporter, partial [Victivallales bacterium]|nr:MFS transporter [Victivallales bacterium]